MFPPLAGHLGAMTGTQAGRDYLVMVIAAGLAGSMRVEGIEYQGIMPAMGAAMGDEGIASVLNFVLRTFNKDSLPPDWQPFTAQEVAGIKARYPGASGQTTRALRESLLSGSKAAGVLDPERARYQWTMHCQGCHGVQAQGTEGGAPRMAGNVARFLHDEAGRSFLVRVPGVALVSLDDRDLADLLNWVLWRFDPDNLPRNFRPYTEGEVRALRVNPLISQAPEERRRVLQKLAGTTP